MTPQDAHARHRERSDLIKAAWRQIAAHGGAATPDRIARDAGLSVARMRQHFPTPQDLMIGVVDEYYSRAMAVCLEHTEGWDTPERAAATWRHFVHALVGLGIGDITTHITPVKVRRIGHDFHTAMAPRQQRLTREVGAVLRRASGHHLITGNVTVPSFLMAVSTISRPVPGLPEKMNRRQHGWMTDIFLRGMRP